MGKLVQRPRGSDHSPLPRAQNKVQSDNEGTDAARGECVSTDATDAIEPNWAGSLGDLLGNEPGKISIAFEHGRFEAAMERTNAILTNAERMLEGQGAR